MELETHLPDASAANRALELLGRELNLFTEKKEVGKPGDFDQMTDEDLREFIEAQGELVRELERQLLLPLARQQRKGAAAGSPQSAQAAQNASTGRTMSGAAPDLSLARCAPASGSTRARK
jgi:hypothetical protein